MASAETLAVHLLPQLKKVVLRKQFCENLSDELGLSGGNVNVSTRVEVNPSKEGLSVLVTVEAVGYPKDDEGEKAFEVFCAMQGEFSAEKSIIDQILNEKFSAHCLAIQIAPLVRKNVHDMLDQMGVNVELLHLEPPPIENKLLKKKSSDKKIVKKKTVKKK